MAILNIVPLALLLACACMDSQAVSAEPTVERAPHSPANRTQSAPESCLGVSDTGIFSDLDSSIQVASPAVLATENPLSARFDAGRELLVLYDGEWPAKVYPTDGTVTVGLGGAALKLRPGDADELRPHLGRVRLQRKAVPAANDRDGDGIPDTLDVLIGALKTVENGANYGGGYRRISYPGGDIPREDGVCTDVVVRAVRNAGLDIQKALQDDIRRAPKAFRMVKKRNPNIDHRRVKTLPPYFERQWEEHLTKLDSATDPYRPGDVIFMDTFPKKKGPDHIGIVSDKRGESGHLLVINNWTDGFKTAEMDLLAFVPVTHRYRIPPR